VEIITVVGISYLKEKRCGNLFRVEREEIIRTLVENELRKTTQIKKDIQKKRLRGESDHVLSVFYLCVGSFSSFNMSFIFDGS